MNKTRDLLHFHFIVVILGFTAILGKLIGEPAEAIVFWRMLLAAIGLAVFIGVKRKNVRIGLRNIIRFLAIGSVVAIHWITFFTTIKLSSISLTLIVLSSTALFTSLLEPLFFKRKVSVLQLMFGASIIVGISLIFKFEFALAPAIWVGILSAILAALFTVLNKKYAHGMDPNVVSFYELSGGWLTVILYSILMQKTHLITHWPSLTDFLFMAALGLICTSYAFTASVKVLRSLDAFIINLSVNMEPVYGVLLGLLIFGESEKMTPGFYVGGFIILLSVFTYPFILKINKQNKAPKTM